MKHLFAYKHYTAETYLIQMWLQCSNKARLFIPTPKDGGFQAASQVKILTPEALKKALVEAAKNPGRQKNRAKKEAKKN